MNKHFLYGWRRGNGIMSYSAKKMPVSIPFSFFQYNGRIYNMHIMLSAFKKLNCLCVWWRCNCVPKHFTNLTESTLFYIVHHRSNNEPIESLISFCFRAIWTKSKNWKWFDATQSITNHHLYAKDRNKHWNGNDVRTLIRMCMKIRCQFFRGRSVLEWNMRQGFVSEQNWGNQEKAEMFYDSLWHRQCCPCGF